MPRPLPNPSAKRSRAGSKRRAAGWMLLALGVLVAAVWVASGWWRGSVRLGDTVRASVGRGSCGWGSGNIVMGGSFWEESVVSGPKPNLQLWYGWNPGGNSTGREFYRPIGLYRRDIYNFAGGTIYNTSFALWPLPLMLWTTGGLALWSGRRARRRALEGHCPTCGYNLAGLNRDAGVGVCPECGKQKTG